MLRRLGIFAAFCCAIALGSALVLSSASAEAARSTAHGTPIGAWLTADGGEVVRIMPCGAGKSEVLCGEIAGIARPPGAPMPTDVEGRPQCGLVIIRDERPRADGAWVGTVRDPRDGASFDARLSVDAAGNLRLRGFLGIPLLGETATWHRFTGKLGAACTMS
jgi:uncharacterized protein (DUF2147 family)